MRKIKNPWTKKEGYDCFGCCPENPIGIHMEFYEDGDDIVSFWNPKTHYQGWVDTMHGGILATIIDETAGWVVFRKLQTAGVTSKMETRFMKEVSTNEPYLLLKANLLEQRRNLALVEACLYDAKGTLCTKAVCTYFTFPKEKAHAEMCFASCDVEADEYELAGGCFVKVAAM